MDTKVKDLDPAPAISPEECSGAPVDKWELLLDAIDKALQCWDVRLIVVSDYRTRSTFGGPVYGCTASFVYERGCLTSSETVHVEAPTARGAVVALIVVLVRYAYKDGIIDGAQARALLAIQCEAQTELAEEAAALLA